MSLTFHWFLPAYGDPGSPAPGRPGSSGGEHRPATLQHLKAVAAAAERSGFESVLAPDAPSGEDAWLTAAMLAEGTERLKFTVTVRPDLLGPVLAARMAATFQRYSGGRLLLNVVAGGDSPDERQRQTHTAQLVTGLRREWASDVPLPQVLLGGTSPQAGVVAAEHANTYLTPGEPASAVAGKIDWIRRLASERGRALSYGIRLHVVARETSARARAEAERPGQWLHGDAGPALVGSYEEVSERISEYADLGIDHFVVSGHPDPEEPARFAEGVVPALSRRGLVTDEADEAGERGETGARDGEGTARRAPLSVPATSS